MASKKEQVIEAVVALITAALPGAEVLRNADKPPRIGPAGVVVVSDGDMGEPVEVTLSPLLYTYEHRIRVEIGVIEGGGLTKEAALDALRTPIADAVAADRTLGGLCEWLEAEPDESDDFDADGAELGRWSEFPIAATYATPRPLN